MKKILCVCLCGVGSLLFCQEDGRKVVELAEASIMANDLPAAKAYVTLVRGWMKIHPDDSVVAQHLRKLENDLFALKKAELIHDDLADTIWVRNPSALNRMRKNYDEIRGVTFYEDKASPKRIQNSTYLYIGLMDGGKPYLRMKIIYYGQNWIFFDKILIKAGARRHRYDPGKTSRDNRGGYVWEIADLGVDEKLYKIILDIKRSGEGKIRLEGDDHYHDRALSKDELASFDSVMSAFLELGGDLHF